MGIAKIKEWIQQIIDQSDWNQVKRPRATVALIEAKAKLLDAIKKLDQVEKILADEE